MTFESYAETIFFLRQLDTKPEKKYFYKKDYRLKTQI